MKLQSKLMILFLNSDWAEKFNNTDSIIYSLSV